MQGKLTKLHACSVCNLDSDHFRPAATPLLATLLVGLGLRLDKLRLDDDRVFCLVPIIVRSSSDWLVLLLLPFGLLARSSLLGRRTVLAFGVVAWMKVSHERAKRLVSARNDSMMVQNLVRRTASPALPRG